jgi:putative AlgH/UPF0301 family transcriptional regulator
MIRVGGCLAAVQPAHFFATMATAAAPQSVSGLSALLTKRLYRSLLRASKPFTSSAYAKVLTCLLYRNGIDIDYYAPSQEADDDDFDNRAGAGAIPTTSSRTLFLRLASELISGDARGVRVMNFPSQVDVTRLRSMIRREFRGDHETSLSYGVDPSVRRQAAFLTLKELNNKLVWETKLRATAPEPHPCQEAPDVHPLPTQPASSYLQPGCFLVAHPHLDGYFRRSVILILDHNAKSRTNAGYGTYGLVINRPASNPESPSTCLTLKEVIRPLPSKLSSAFSASPVREGGPVHMSLQMLHSVTCEQQEEFQLGGHLVTPIATDGADDGNTSASTLKEGKTIYYGGDLLRVAAAALEGGMDRNRDVVFFAGASSWSSGHLESEVERGYWLPCRGPVSVALTGSCHDHDGDAGASTPRPKPDVWLSMMAACGKDEAAIAHLLLVDNGDDDFGRPCDADQ